MLSNGHFLRSTFAIALVVSSRIQYEQMYPSVVYFSISLIDSVSDGCLDREHIGARYLLALILTDRFTKPLLGESLISYRMAHFRQYVFTFFASLALLRMALYTLQSLH